MEFYALLSFVTLIIALLTWHLWVRTQDLSIVMGAAFLYYWTLGGAWFIVYAARGGSLPPDFHFIYLEPRLVFVVLDSNYLEALIIYSMFVMVILGALLLVVKRNFMLLQRSAPTFISHYRLIVVGALSLAASYLIIGSSLQSAFSLNVSGYAFTRRAMESSVLFPVHQLLNLVSLYSFGLGIAVLASGRDAKYLRGQSSITIFAGYSILTILLLGFLIMLGNRSDMLVGGVCGVLFYAANCRRRRLPILIGGAAVILALLPVMEYIRSHPIQGGWTELLSYDLLSIPLGLVGSNEMFAAHMSLYAALSRNIPPTYGTSFTYLFSSLIPRFVSAARPPGIYEYYADQNASIAGQGYTVHHATGWYLNFGVIGVLLGAIILGWFWAKLLNSSLRAWAKQNLFFRVIAILSPYTFIAVLPRLLRDGPEGYKGLLVEGILLPAALVMICAFRRPQARVALGRPRGVTVALSQYPFQRQGATKSAQDF